MNLGKLKPPTRMLNSLDMMKHMEMKLRTASRMHMSGMTVVLIPAENVEAWIEFLNKTIMATEARKEKETNGRRKSI